MEKQDVSKTRRNVEVHGYQSNPTKNTEGHSRDGKKYQDSSNSGREASMNRTDSGIKEKIGQIIAEK